jgi:hypothetical protein
MAEENRLRQPGSMRRVHWSPLALILLASCPPSAWASVPDVAAPDCSAADLDVSYQFVNQSANEQVIVNFRNISQRPCTLRPGAGVSFADLRHGHSISTKECQNCDADGRANRWDPITVAVGATAYLVVSWEAAPVDGSGSCQEGGELNSYVNSDLKHGYSIWSRRLLRDVCSVVRFDSYFPGAFGEVNEQLGNDAQRKASVTINLTPSGEVYYADDSFWLYADISDPDEVLPPGEHSCPALLLRTRASDGTAVLEDADGRCRITPAGERPGRLIRFEMSTRWEGALATRDEIRVELLALLGSSHAAQVEMASSNALTLHAVTSASLPRRWGPEVKGLAVSLSLDKETYVLGEDIPLRLAVENFSATADIVSGELPCSAGLTFDVRDSSGRAVQTPGNLPCRGHGWSQDYPRGKIVPVMGLTLEGQGGLPDQPGDYTVTAAWEARGQTNWETSVGPAVSAPPSMPQPPYAVVHSAQITFHVVRRLN